MPSSSSPPAAVAAEAIACIPPSAVYRRPATDIPHFETTTSLSSSHSNPRAATRFPHAQHRPAPQSPPSDVAAIPQAPALHHPTTPSFYSTTQPSEHRPRAAPSPADKVDSKPRTIAATVKSRAHSRLASLGRIRPRGGQQPAEPQHQQQQQQQYHLPVTEPPPPVETYPVEPTPSLTGSHKRSEPSTASYHSSETTLTDEKFHDTKSFEESRQQYIPKYPQRNKSTERQRDSEDQICDPTEEYHRLLETRPRMMHQTSSRLLRMTEDDRPFTKVK